MTLDELVSYWSLPVLILLACSGCSQQPETKNEQSSMPTDSSENAESKIPEQWDFYLCKVDDAAASITLNIWFRDQGPIKSADNLYWCQIEMQEPGDHGMGVGNDAKALNEIEDAIVKRTQVAGFYYVGRLRNHGRWQLVFYGRGGLEPALRKIVVDNITDSSEREYFVGSKLDSEWSYYFEFLYPNSERWQWIMDRRVIESLESEGDPLTQLRRVDHWLYFDSGEKRDQFIEVAQEKGFELQQANDDSQGTHPFSAQVFRVDSVQLEEIHDVVMSLKRIVDDIGGEYDGWETSVERP